MAVYREDFVLTVAVRGYHQAQHQFLRVMRTAAPGIRWSVIVPRDFLDDVTLRPGLTAKSIPFRSYQITGIITD